jgi:exosortase/archaeosortase
MKPLRLFFFIVAFFAAIFYLYSAYRFGHQKSELLLVITLASSIVGCVFLGYEKETPQEASARKWASDLMREKP